MAASLDVLEQRLENKRSALAGKHAEKDEIFAAVDQLIVQIEALEAEDELSEEQQAELERYRDELKAQRKASSQIADASRKLEADISDLEADRLVRIEHNRVAAENQRDSNRQVAPSNPGLMIPEREAARPVQKLSQEEAERDIIHFFRANYLAQQNGTSIRNILAGDADHKYDPTLQYRNDRLLAAVDTTNHASVIPPNYVANLIEMLRPAPIVRNLAGVRQIPLPNGNLRMPRQVTGTTANYIGEMVNIPLSETSVDQLTWNAKKLTVMTVQSGEIMRRSSPSSDAMIRDDIVLQYQEKEDVTFIRSDQTATIPGGLKYFADQLPATQVIAANGAATLASTKRDLGLLMLALRQQNVPMRNRHWLMSPRTEQFLLDIVDGNGNPGYPEMERGILRRYPYHVTTQIPENLGGGGNESEIYFVEGSEFVIADTDTFEFNASIEAAYHDGANVQAAFSQDACVIRLIVEHDTNIRHNESVAYLNGVTWGA